jgi:hypothetical protein
MSGTAPIIDLRPWFEDTGTPPDPRTPDHPLGRLVPVDAGDLAGAHG